MRRLTATACAALSAAGIITLTGCHSGKPHAATSALATSTAVKADRQQAAQIAKKCLPASETAQIKYARILVASKTGKYAQQGEQERQQLGQCAGIPPQNRQAFENAAISAALHGHLAAKTGRQVFFETTLPQLVVQYR